MNNVDVVGIAEKVKQIVVDKLSVDPDKVVDGANFADDLGADSLGRFELMMQLEEEFDCEIPEEEAEKITTVKAAIEYLTQHHAILNA